MHHLGDSSNAFVFAFKTHFDKYSANWFSLLREIFNSHSPQLTPCFQITGSLSVLREGLDSPATVTQLSTSSTILLLITFICDCLLIPPKEDICLLTRPAAEGCVPHSSVPGAREVSGSHSRARRLGGGGDLAPAERRPKQRRTEAVRA